MSYQIEQALKNQPFVPEEHWPTLEEMADGFNEYKYPPSQFLAGKKANLRFENGWLIEHHFVDDSTLTWTIIEGEGTGASETETYEAVEVRPGIFFVEFLKPEHQESATLVWKYETGDVLAAVSAFYKRGSEKRTRTDFVTAVVDGKPGGSPILQASSLVGKRVLYRYSADDWYEHVYFGAQTMAWHCVNGAEKGLADVERCAYFDVADDLYVLFWTETIMPVESVIVVDLAQMRSIGRFFCWDPKPGKLIHLTFGSKATVLNEAAYPTSF
ncbi:molybdenum cofactor biosynthesis F family protein [Pseudomonas thivervalensis]|uniref:Uncharacterized protein n=1 Tax=Pseudomonas thivervalensis TaxID=86265 RepID=A0A176NEC8_9PSED|nr:molybdenum cofactor biosynthesis F family protein [Pseudomonas thivervalensis]AXA54251.1 hypothetical protein CE140_07700 [Pseudomonas thivervalensis]AXA59931.1 hypothetical protein CEQ51_07540 [Pseudomonas thivervalensis]OAB49491.1 hypothetical protein APS14_13170 [Pseudomonas thivervalensis]SDF71521.1 Molybdenum cofactor biosynthesis protein F [Pseudomonas thivervalensis]